MDDFMMYKYLQERTEDMDERKFINKFKEYMNNKRNSMRPDYDWEEMPSKNRSNWNFNIKRDNEFTDDDYKFFEKYNRKNIDMDDEEIYKFMKSMKRNSMHEYFDEPTAKHLVSKMYHLENGRKYVGEKFDMSKAKEVKDRYKEMLHTQPSICEIYIAINAQYHDYAELYKSWFGSNIDQKIIESAIVFWFKDVDSPSDNKLADYFKEF